MHVEIRTEYISEWYHIASSPNCKPAINGLHKFRVPFTDSLAIQRMNIKLINDKKEEERIERRRGLRSVNASPVFNDYE